MLIRDSSAEGSPPWVLAVVAFLLVLAFTAPSEQEGAVADAFRATGFYLIFTGNFVVRKGRPRKRARRRHAGSESAGTD
jgi:hypothetical protein